MIKKIGNYLKIRIWERYLQNGIFEKTFSETNKKKSKNAAWPKGGHAKRVKPVGPACKGDCSLQISLIPARRNHNLLSMLKVPAGPDSIPSLAFYHLITPFSELQRKQSDPHLETHSSHRRHTSQGIQARNFLGHESSFSYLGSKGTQILSTNSTRRVNPVWLIDASKELWERHSRRQLLHLLSLVNLWTVLLLGGFVSSSSTDDFDKNDYRGVPDGKLVATILVRIIILPCAFVKVQRVTEQIILDSTILVLLNCRIKISHLCPTANSDHLQTFLKLLKFHPHWVSS